MLALRSFARSAPRSVARLSTRVARPQSSIIRAAAFQPSWTASAPRLTSAFHISAVRRDDVSQELVAKLQNEIALEEEMKEDEDLSANIREYLESSPFEIEDKPGQQEIVLTREYNGEKIRVTFTIADLNNVEEPENDEDSAMYDNDVDDIVDGQSGGANTKGAINQGNTKDGNFRIAPEDRIAPADREELEDEYDEDNQPEGFPARAHIRIERPGKGALSIEATAQDGDFLIEDLAWFEKAENADPQTAEASWSKQSLYAGPPFANLDEDLQLLMEKYLEERGINTRLALFIPDYIDHKEQKEYIRWLKNVKKFVE